MNHEKQEKAQIKPSEFMRKLHPDLFSDSSKHKIPHLKRSEFEYHLETLTNRGEENIFEHFCRHLLEAEICPNLLPHTGPTGGGDSKVDSENYPVTEQVSERWYIGTNSSTNDRWAFAFSAKKDWKPKAKIDIKKIFETNRGYKVIYFVSNQFIRDKERAELEDELSKEYSLVVKILDRSWIIDIIFNNSRFSLASRFFDISIVEELKVGPEDYRRKQELEILEQQINDPNRYPGVEFQLVEDAIEACMLARSLELPRVEVEGRYSRAKNLANKYGTKEQQLRSIYNHAWTSFYWFDDPKTFNSLIDEAIKIDFIQDSSELELISNLYMTLKAAVLQGLLTPEVAKVTERGQVFYDLCKKMEEDSSRPANMLWAKMMRLMHEIQKNAADSEAVEKSVQEITSVIQSARGLLAFPMVGMLNVVHKIEPLIQNSKSMDKLFDLSVEILKERNGDREAGERILQRGIGLLEKNKYNEAIKYLGRAQTLLAKEETYSELITTLFCCGLAYRYSGLNWAARKCFIASVERILSRFQTESVLSKKILPSLRLLSWIELENGRITCALNWIDILSVLENQLNLSDEERKIYEEDRLYLDMAMAVQILHSKARDLKVVAGLPITFRKLGMPASETAALFTIGEFEALLPLMPECKSKEEVEQFFIKMLKQPAFRNCKIYGDYYLENHVLLSSKILGCNIAFKTKNNVQDIVLAETFLAMLESLLGTGYKKVYPFKADQLFLVKPDTNVEVLTVNKDKNDETTILYNEKFFLSTKDVESRKKMYDAKMETTIKLAMEFIKIPDIETFSKSVLEEEQSFSRTSAFSDLGTLLANVLDKRKLYSISEWQILTPEYKTQRSSDWISTLSPEQYSIALDLENEQEDESLFDSEVRHDQMSVSNIIDIDKWNDAGWSGMLYLTPPNFPPVMFVGFSNFNVGISIFENMIKSVGRENSQGALAVSIIKGINEKESHGYAVMVGPDKNIISAEKQRGLLISRINKMYPSSDVNLKNFLDSYEKYGFCYLAPIEFAKHYAHNPKEIVKKYGIKHSQIKVIDAWQLTENEMEISVLDKDINPIIPAGVKDPPVLKALEKLKLRQNSKRP